VSRRRPLAVLAAAAVAGLGGVILGEYAYDGLAVIGSAVVLGLFVAEAALAVAKETSTSLAVAYSALTVAGLGWAAWTSTGHRLGVLGVEAWLAFAAGAAAAGLRARPRSTPAGNPPASPPPA
jgi:hypothetical protein